MDSFCCDWLMSSFNSHQLHQSRQWHHRGKRSLMSSDRRRKMRISLLIKEWSHLISQSLGWEKTEMNSTRGEEQEEIIMRDWCWLQLRHSSEIFFSRKDNWLNESLDELIDSWWSLSWIWLMNLLIKWHINHKLMHFFNLSSIVRWLGWSIGSNVRNTPMEEEGLKWIQFNVIRSQLNYFR